MEFCKFTRCTKIEERLGVLTEESPEDTSKEVKSDNVDSQCCCCCSNISEPINQGYSEKLSTVPLVQKVKPETSGKVNKSNRCCMELRKSIELSVSCNKCTNTYDHCGCECKVSTEKSKIVPSITAKESIGEHIQETGKTNSKLYTNILVEYCNCNCVYYSEAEKLTETSTGTTENITTEKLETNSFAPSTEQSVNDKKTSFEEDIATNKLYSPKGSANIEEYEQYLIEKPMKLSMQTTDFLNRPIKWSKPTTILKCENETIKESQHKTEKVDSNTNNKCSCECLCTFPDKKSSGLMDKSTDLDDLNIVPTDESIVVSMDLQQNSTKESIEPTNKCTYNCSSYFEPEHLVSKYHTYIYSCQIKDTIKESIKEAIEESIKQIKNELVGLTNLPLGCPTKNTVDISLNVNNCAQESIIPEQNNEYCLQVKETSVSDKKPTENSTEPMNKTKDLTLGAEQVIHKSNIKSKNIKKKCTCIKIKSVPVIAEGSLSKTKGIVQPASNSPTTAESGQQKEINDTTKTVCGLECNAAKDESSKINTNTHMGNMEINRPTTKCKLERSANELMDCNPPCCIKIKKAIIQASLIESIQESPKETANLEQPKTDKAQKEKCKCCVAPQRLCKVTRANQVLTGPEDTVKRKRSKTLKNVHMKSDKTESKNEEECDLRTFLEDRKCKKQSKKLTEKVPIVTEEDLALINEYIQNMKPFSALDTAKVDCKAYDEPGVFEYGVASSKLDKYLLNDEDMRNFAFLKSDIMAGDYLPAEPLTMKDLTEKTPKPRPVEPITTTFEDEVSAFNEQNEEVTQPQIEQQQDKETHLADKIKVEGADESKIEGADESKIEGADQSKIQGDDKIKRQGVDEITDRILHQSKDLIVDDQISTDGRIDESKDQVLSPKLSVADEKEVHVTEEAWTKSNQAHVETYNSLEKMVSENLKQTQVRRPTIKGSKYLFEEIVKEEKEKIRHNSISTSVPSPTRSARSQGRKRGYSRFFDFFKGWVSHRPSVKKQAAKRRSIVIHESEDDLASESESDLSDDARDRKRTASTNAFSTRSVQSATH